MSNRKNKSIDRNYIGYSNGRIVANGPNEKINRTYGGIPTLTHLLSKVIGKRPITVNQVREKLLSRFGTYASYGVIRASLLRHPNEFNLVEQANGIAFTKAS